MSCNRNILIKIKAMGVETHYCVFNPASPKQEKPRRRADSSSGSETDDAVEVEVEVEVEWPEAATRKLIAHRLHLEYDFDSPYNESEAEVDACWESVSRMMEEDGYDYAAEMCKSKWINLLRAWRRRGSQEVHVHQDGSVCYEELHEYCEAKYEGYDQLDDVVIGCSNYSWDLDSLNSESDELDMESLGSGAGAQEVDDNRQIGLNRAGPENEPQPEGCNEQLYRLVLRSNDNQLEIVELPRVRLLRTLADLQDVHSSDENEAEDEDSLSAAPRSASSTDNESNGPTNGLLLKDRNKSKSSKTSRKLDPESSTRVRKGSLSSSGMSSLSPDPDSEAKGRKRRLSGDEDPVLACVTKCMKTFEEKLVLDRAERVVILERLTRMEQRSIQMDEHFAKMEDRSRVEFGLLRCMTLQNAVILSQLTQSLSGVLTRATQPAPNPPKKVVQKKSIEKK